MKETDISKTTSELFKLLLQFQKKLLKPSETIIRAEISPTHFYALSILRYNPMTASALTKEIDISKQQLTPILDRLEKHGFITKKSSLLDKRSMIIKLTDDGIDFLDKQNEYINALLKDRISVLDDDNIAYLAVTFEKLNSILSKI